MQLNMYNRECNMLVKMEKQIVHFFSKMGKIAIIRHQ